MGTRSAIAVLAAAIGLAATVAACGEESESEPAAPEVEATRPVDADGAKPAENGSRPQKPPNAPGSGPAETPEGDPRLTALEREALRTARDYVAALDARDGAHVCSLLTPGALAGVELPRDRGGCAESLDASIGYRDPRGLPVFESARTRGGEVELRDGTAQVVLTAVTQFADREQPSIEDDVIHLALNGERWSIVQPSSTLYRAIGAEVPLSAIQPPSG
jgi:hypothetical protein